MALTKSSVLHYWSARYGINPRIGGRPVFTRNSAGLFTTQEGETNTAIVNTPRFDWATLNLPNSLTERRKVLTLEMARTNSLSLSDQFDNAAWIKANCSITANGFLAPDGTQTADKLVENSTPSVIHLVERGFTGASDSTQQTISVYLKASGRNWGFLEMTTKAATAWGAYFNLANGTIGTVETGVTAQIYPVWDGWYRCVISRSAETGGSATDVAIYSASADNTKTYTGNGADGILMWGAQLELNTSIVTSYAATTTASATRTADNLYWNYTPPPQYLLVYCRFIEAGTIGITDARIFSIGNNANGNPRFFVRMTGARYSVRHETSAGIRDATITDASPGIGDTTEIVATLGADGAVYIYQSHNAGTVFTAQNTTALTLATIWGDTKLYVNSDTASGNLGAIKLAELKIVKRGDMVGTTATEIMDEIRAFELGPNGDVL